MLEGKKYERVRNFCRTLVRLWKEQHALGVAEPMVGRDAAIFVGYGGKSWSSKKTIQAADVMYNKLTKKPDVLEYIRELGLERDGRGWKEV